MRCAIARRLGVMLLTSVWLVGGGAALAAKDDDDDEESKPPSPMQMLDGLKGIWSGETQGVNAVGESVRLRHSARVGNLLDGDLLVIETRALQTGGRIGEHSLAVISHDAGTGRYEIRAYAHGRAGSYPLLVTGKGVQWDVPLGRGATLRQRIDISGAEWHEVHEFLALDKPPRRTLDIQMQRRGDSDWPAAGAP